MLQNLDLSLPVPHQLYNETVRAITTEYRGMMSGQRFQPVTGKREDRW